MYIYIFHTNTSPYPAVLQLFGQDLFKEKLADQEAGMKTLIPTSQ